MSVGGVSIRDRFRGCLVGLAAGDALGTTLEFSVPGSFDPIDDMVGGGPFGLGAGQWTDDTSMALCLATSLLESGGFDPVDQMGRYLRWFREGYLSSTGECFDIGGTTREALVRFERTGEPYSGSTDPMSAGNGSLMRLAPVPMFFAGDAWEAIDRSADSSRTTHGAVEAVDACRYFAGLLVGALRGVDKESLLSERYSPVEGLWDEAPLAPKIAAIAAGSFKHKQPPEIRGAGYVVDTLEAVLWAFLPHRGLQRGCPQGGQPRPGRRHHRSDLRPDRRCPLRSRVHPCRVAPTPDDERRDCVAHRPRAGASVELKAPHREVSGYINLCCIFSCMNTVRESRTAAHDGRSDRSLTVVRRSKFLHETVCDLAELSNDVGEPASHGMAEIEACCDRVRHHLKEARTPEHEDARLSRNAGVVIR